MSTSSHHLKRGKSSRNGSSNSGSSHRSSGNGSIGHCLESSSRSHTSKMNIGYIVDQEPVPRSEGIPPLRRTTSLAVREHVNSPTPDPVGERRMSISNILNSPPRSGSNLHPRSTGGVGTSARESNQQNYVCSFPQCGARFSTYSAIKSHRANMHGLESHQCIYCKTVLAREANLMYHVNSKHRKPGENWCYKCTFKSFDFHTFKKHMETVHASRKCGKCGKQVARNLQVQHSAQCSGSKRGRR